MPPDTRTTAERPVKIGRWFWPSQLLAGGMAALLLGTGQGTLPAQVVLDGTFGTSGALSGPNYNITQGMGLTRGNNLFQSFAQFNLTAGEVATFAGVATIQNILCRVTGGGASSINGTLRSGIAGANVFFINPNGIIFGPNAVVDVSGSFAASTANYLKLADGARFVAALDADDSGLSTAPVSAFGFLTGNPGGITVQQCALSVPGGQTFSLVGGNITVDGGSVQAPQGQINVVSVQSQGEVPADPTALSAAEFSAMFPQQGQINLLNLAQLDASGDGGGRIVIRGGSLVVDNSVIQANSTGATDGQGIDIAVPGDLQLSNGGQINSLSTLGLGAGGDITLNAGSIRLDGGGLVDANGYPSTQISTSTGDPFLGGGTARGGNIVIHTGSLEMINSAQITSASFDAGNAGDIDITATSIRLDTLFTSFVQISANTQQIDGGGNAGNIIIHTGSLDLYNGAELVAESFGSGQAGLIDINAQSVNLYSASLIIAAAFGSGNGGDINVTANSLLINGQDTLYGGPDLLTGIQAVTTSPDSPAPGGGVHIDAGSVELDHLGSIFTTSYGAGSGGNIEITTGNLTLANVSSITAAAYANGSAGIINISAGNATLQGGSSIDSSSLGSGLVDGYGQPLIGGTAGSVNLQLSGSLSLSGQSRLSVSSAENDAGDVTVTAGGNITLQDSGISAQAALNGGNISLSSPSLIYLLRSPLTANAQAGNGGVITLDPSFVVLNDSPITAQVSIIGNGGQVNIASDYFFASDSPFNVTTPSGIPGTVTVTAPDVDLSGSLVGLPNDLLDAESRLRPDCAVRLAGDVSTFTLLGRGGLPMEPGGFVPSMTGPTVNELQ
jgi:filamentous hemagglutinin family protein